MYRHIHIGYRWLERPSTLSWIYIQAKTLYLEKGLWGLETSEITCFFEGSRIFFRVVSI